MKYIKEERIKPIIIGGIVGGVLFSFLPFPTYIIPYLLSGVITAYLISKEFPRSNMEYIVAGGLSGGIGGFVSWCLDMLIIIAAVPSMVSYYIDPSMTGYYIEEVYMESRIAVDWYITYIPFYVVIGAISGVIGGILYGKLKNK
ncbi:hypothetical protein KKP97_01055 [Methanothermococcus sp. SCGC AD-155-C09]|nr:hypothetical protein [Methanothermococcus sp. SCGC AD-155-C09]